MPQFIVDMGNSLDEYDGGAILPWITTASPRDVALLAIWNKARRDHLQTRINEDTDSLQQYTRDSASYLMDSGIYPAGVDELHEMAFEYYGKFKAIDSFESGLQGAAGYSNSEVRAISNLYTRSDLVGIGRYFKSVAFHEDTHSVMWLFDRGFMRGLATRHEYLRLWEEFWASHVQAVSSADSEPGYDKRRPFVTNPHVRDDSNRSYITEATYSTSIAQKAEPGISADLFGHAYMAPFDSKIRSDLENRIVMTLGSRAMLFDVADEYEKGETRSERNGVIAKAMAQLYGFWDEMVEVEERMKTQEVGTVSYKA
jgi:hypothetical protein